MSPEARLERTDEGLVPASDGWFVLSTREAVWAENDDNGRYTRWEGEGEAGFAQVGINISSLRPGQPMCMYHAEDAQEDFLVLAGEGILVVEGEERQLKAWDFVHCPAGTRHVIVAAGDAPMLVLAVGARGGGGVLYPRDEVAARYRASVEQDTTEPREAYAGTDPLRPTRYVEGDLPNR